MNKEYANWVGKLKLLIQYEEKRGEPKPKQKLCKEKMKIVEALVDTKTREESYKCAITCLMLRRVREKLGMSYEDIKKEKKNGESTEDVAIRLFLPLTQSSPSE